MDPSRKQNAKSNSYIAGYNRYTIFVESNLALDKKIPKKIMYFDSETLA